VKVIDTACALIYYIVQNFHYLTIFTKPFLDTLFGISLLSLQAPSPLYL